MNQKKLLTKVFSLLICLILAFSALVGCGEGNKEDSSKSHLYIAVYDAGVGTEWLESLKTRFEAEYANEEFEEGKKGVEVHIDAAKTYTLEAMLSSKNNIIIQENVDVYTKKSGFLNITDWVKEEVYENEENKSIYDKMYDSQKDYLFENGECYFVPHYQCFGGVVYDIDLFNSKLLYIAEDLDPFGNCKLVSSLDENMSKGPDGKEDTYDDGLPATNDELLFLCRQMSEQGITPFIWTGKSIGYTKRLIQSSYVSMAGESVAYNYTFDSGDKTVNIVDGFSGNVPQVSTTTITSNNGHLMKKQLEIYNALNLFEKIVDNVYYDEETCFSTKSMIEAQATYLESAPLGKPIAMLVEYSYWYNEAESSINYITKNYPNYTDRKFGIMPMPSVNSGTHKDVAENVDSYGVISTGDCYMGVNKNTSSSASVQKMCKAFIQFANSDESLTEFTKISKTTKALKYTISDTEKASLPYYTQTVIDAKKRAEDNNRMFDFGSSNDIFKYVRTYFGIGSNQKFFNSYIDKEYSYPAELFKKGTTAREYFLGIYANMQDACLNYFH